MNNKAKELWLYFFSGIVFVTMIDFAAAVVKDQPLPQDLAEHCINYPKFHSDCEDYVD